MTVKCGKTFSLKNGKKTRFLQKSQDLEKFFQIVNLQLILEVREGVEGARSGKIFEIPFFGFQKLFLRA